MKIKTLVENTTISEEFRSEHGLCLYIETEKHKILFDLGKQKRKKIMKPKRRKEMKTNMKIAVASEKGMVTEHFGHCESFGIFDIENNKIIKSESVPNPGHRPGFLPNFLNELGVNVIISGGMGGGAIDIFNEKGIEVIVGTKGSSEGAVKSYLQGELQSTGSVCHEHQHHEECGN